MKLIYFDISALIVFLMIIITMLVKNIYRGKTNRILFALVTVSMLTVIADIGAVAADNMGSGHVDLKYFMHSAYLILHGLTTPAYVIFVIAMTDSWHLIKKHRVNVGLLVFPMSVIVIAVIANIFTGDIFYLDSTDTYTRGSHFFVLYVVALTYFSFGMQYMVRYKGAFEKRRFWAIFISLPMPFVAALVQMIYPNLIIEMFVNSICLLYIALVVNRTEEIVDAQTGLYTSSAYIKNLNAAVYTQKQVRIIMVNITNYSTVRQLISYEDRRVFKKQIASKLTELNSKKHLDADLYYMDGGKFRLVIRWDKCDKADEIAQIINMALKQTVVINQMAIQLMACVCIVDFPSIIPNVDALLAFGNDFDGKFYNGEVLYARDIYRSSTYDYIKDIDGIIEHAIAHDEFDVYYQPIYSVVEKCYNSAEALCRLKLEDGTFIAPDIFIPAAEKSGAIHRIGNIVLEKVCEFIASDTFKRLKLQYIEVNLSVSQCMQKELASNVLDMIKKYNIDVSQINLEITETAASYSQDTMMDNLTMLTNSGIKLSLDDFGTGYSNMLRIATLPLYIVKLDKTFVDLAKTSEADIVIQNMIRMIKELDLKIVVEGVETKELANKFSSLECEYIQGYYYSKPLPKDNFINFVEESPMPA